MRRNAIRERLSLVLAALALASLAAVVLLQAAGPLRTNDLWFHLGAGEAYAREGPWPARDPMLHTATSRAPVQHEWLFGLGVFGVEAAAGPDGLRFLHAALASAILGLAFWQLQRASRSRVVACLGTAGFVALSWWRLVQLRPDLLSILATLAVAGLVLLPAAPLSRRRIAGYAALSAVWANVHSLFALGPLLIAAVLVGLGLRHASATACESRRARMQHLAAALVAGLLAALANPRGWNQHLTFFQSSRDSAIWAISDEWRAFPIFGPPAADPALSPLAWFVAATLALAFAATWVGRAIAALRGRGPLLRSDSQAVSAALAAAALVALATSLRFLWMGFFPLLFFVLEFESLSEPLRRRLRIGAAAATAALAVAFWYPAANGRESLGGAARRLAALPTSLDAYLETDTITVGLYPSGVEFLAETGIEGNLFNRYTMGGYLGWRLAPTLRTFVDGRTEHYAASVLEDYFRIVRWRSSAPDVSPQDALDRYGVNVFFGVGVPVDGEAVYSTTHLENDPDWQLVWRAFDHAIYLRADDGPASAANRARVMAFCREHRLPCQASQDIDPLAWLESRPSWAVQRKLAPPGHESWLAASAGADAGARAEAQSRIATLRYLLGAYQAAADIDRELLSLDPRASLPRRRLVYSLLHLGRTAEATAAAARLARMALSDPKAAQTVQLARHLAAREARGDPAHEIASALASHRLFRRQELTLQLSPLPRNNPPAQKTSGGKSSDRSGRQSAPY